MITQGDLISIVIPVYNSGKFIKECLESVIKQTYTFLDIIIINDGSTDESAIICKEYVSKDDRIRYIEKKNEGLSSARRTGIREVKGKYFCTVDADDIVDERYVEKLYLSIIHYNADIALCGRMSFDDKGEIIYYPLEDHLLSCRNMDLELITREYARLVVSYQMGDSWNKMYRTKFVKEAGIYHELERKYNGTDLLFNYLLLLHNPRVAAVHEILYKYRIVKGSIVHRRNKPLQEGFEIITKRLIKECKQLNYSKKVQRQIMMAYYGMLKYATLEISTENRGKKRKEMLNVCVREHRRFIKEIRNDIGARGIILQKKINLKVFYAMLYFGNVNGIYIYYGVRDWWGNK